MNDTPGPDKASKAQESGMSLPLRKQTGYTIEEWKTWEGRWELINGVFPAAVREP